MKTMILLLFTAISLSAFAQREQQYSRDEILKEARMTGKNHNAALSSIYSSLGREGEKMTNGGTQFPPIEYWLHLLEQGISPYLLAQQPGYIQTMNQWLTSIFLNVFRKGGGAEDAVEQLLIDAGLEPVVREHTNELLRIGNSFTNAEDLDKQLNAFYEKVFKQFGTNATAFSLIAGGEVLKSSEQYWGIVGPDWKKMLAYSAASKGSASRIACCKAILLSDAAGAVVGGIRGGMAGAVAGGVGAVPGAIAGAAIQGVGASATTALASWLGSIF